MRRARFFGINSQGQLTMPSYQEILDILYEELQPFVDPGEALAEDMELVGDLDLDSLKIMDLLPRVEDRFDISIPLNVLPDVTTIKDLARQVERLTG
jgi:acyl carrier protein